jgi:hypothetical protein
MIGFFIRGRKDGKLRRVENIPSCREDEKTGNLIFLDNTYVDGRLLVRRYPHPTDSDQSIVDILVRDDRIIKEEYKDKDVAIA